VTPPTPGDQLSDLALRTVDLLAEFVEERTPESNDQRFLLAYVKRIESLLKGMAVLYERETLEPVLVVYRTLFEVWAHAMFLALEREVALDRLQQQLEHERVRMDKAFGTVSGAQKGGRSLPFSCLMDMLGGILRREDAGMMPDWTRVAYDTQYRVASFHYVHGHLGCTVPHLDDSGKVRTSLDDAPARHVLAMGAALACSLLIAASRSFGTNPPNELSDIVPKLQQEHSILLENRGTGGNG